MNRQQALDYLTRCADDNGTHWHGGHSYAEQDCPTCHGTNNAGHLATPCSRYGRTSAAVAPVAYQYAAIVARSDSEALSHSLLSECMSLVVNDSSEPLEAIRDYVVGLSGADLDAMVTGYLECQLWAQYDYDHPSCDCHANDPQNACHNYQLDHNYDLDDIDLQYIEAVRDELADLIVEHPLAVRMYLGYSDEDHFGRDFYLTRERHGAGFWDRGLGELGRYLTDIAHWAGPASDLWDNGDGVLAA